MKALKAISGAVFLAFGLFGCAVTFFAIIDPVGTQLADENNPFGTPPNIASSLTRLMVYGAISVLGAYLLSRLKSSRHGA